MKIMNLQQLSNLTRISALCVLGSAFSANAAVISIADFSSTPDGSVTRFGQNFDVATPNGENVLTNSPGQKFVYVVSTFTFAAGTSVDIGFGFDSTGGVADASPDRVGIEAAIASNPDRIQFIGGPSANNSSLGALPGQTITLIMKLDYDVNRSTTNNDDNIASAWFNPTISSTEGSPTMVAAPANSYNFPEFILFIDNNSTLAGVGASTITNTTVLTGADATFANALALATVPEPNTAMLIGLAGFNLLLRRRRC